uniref:IRS-type PTB domain-containing protein n=1 Tax=Macrostomum lignano TaxID=282301 RepID=A0A1I8HVP9_9PLAT
PRGYSYQAMNERPSRDPAVDPKNVSVQLPVPGGGSSPRNLTITLAISVQVTEIPGVTIGLAGVDLKHAGPVIPDVSTVPASTMQQQPATRCGTDEASSINKEKKILQQQQQLAGPGEPATSEALMPPEPVNSALPVAPQGKPLPPTSSGTLELPTQPSLPLPSASSARAGKKPNKGGKTDENKTENGDDSSDDEIDMTKAAAAADLGGRNTVESEIGDNGENTCGSGGAGKAGASGRSKKFQLFGRSKKDKPKGNADSGTFNFPQDLPDNAKTLFQIMSDSRLIATVYASNAGRTPAVKKQKALLTESAEKRFTVDGKSRSVWLDPPAGEKVEIWKEYFGDDGECNRALGRLPGTDKYGYILRDEIDEEGQFAPKEEQEAYNDSLQLLTMFMDIYGND